MERLEQEWNCSKQQEVELAAKMCGTLIFTAFFIQKSGDLGSFAATTIAGRCPSSPERGWAGSR